VSNPADQYEQGKLLGKGSFGSVYLVRHRREGVRYVIKKVSLSKATKEERDAARREAKVLSALKHPNIVAYKDSFMDRQGCLNIVMAYCDGGDL
jgi:NIMA (never in mitosis gene a)-related kinase